MAFKDGNGRIRRQAARFRVFGLNAAGEVIQEMTASDNVTLQWTVAVANRKASGVRFSGVRHDMRPWDKPDDESQLRNRSEKDRTKLDIVPTLEQFREPTSRVSSSHSPMARFTVPPSISENYAPTRRDDCSSSAGMAYLPRGRVQGR
jgi:hypothetical protein